MTRWFADTSVSVPVVVTSHDAHATVSQLVASRRIELPAHAALETYSVLTRLPGDARLRPSDAARLIRERFGRAVPLSLRRAATLVDELAPLDVSGGAVYDALIALTAVEADATLLTRDARAASTYTALNLTYEVVSG